MIRARAIALTLAAATIPISTFAAERPPQFVAIAFDNCTELSRWRELAEFSARLNEKGETVHFTFFVSGVNFLTGEKRALYQAPHELRGHARIPFGAGKEEIAERIRAITD